MVIETSAGTITWVGLDPNVTRPQPSVRTNLMLQLPVPVPVGVKVVDTAPAAVSDPVACPKVPEHDADHVYEPGVEELNVPPVTLALTLDAVPDVIVAGTVVVAVGDLSIPASRWKLRNARCAAPDPTLPLLRL